MYRIMRAVQPNHNYAGVPEMEAVPGEYPDAAAVVARLIGKALDAADYGRLVVVIGPDGEVWTASDFVYCHAGQ
jgi:hypothetical protein